MEYSLITNVLKERIQCQQMTGKSTTSLSFLPDDQQRHGMETETVALLPVLRRLEVMMVAKGFLKGLFSAKRFLEYSFGSKRFLNLWLSGGCWRKWCCRVLGWSSSAPGAPFSHSGFCCKASDTLIIFSHTQVFNFSHTQL